MIDRWELDMIRDERNDLERMLITISGVISSCGIVPIHARLGLLVKQEGHDCCINLSIVVSLALE
jgi:hypothetical protein